MELYEIEVQRKMVQKEKERHDNMRQACSTEPISAWIAQHDEENEYIDRIGEHGV